MEYEVFTEISGRRVVAIVLVDAEESEVTTAWLETCPPENDHRPVRTPLALADLHYAEDLDLCAEAEAWWEDDHDDA